MAAQALLKLGMLTGETTYRDTAERSLRRVGKLMTQYPSGFGEWLNAASLILGEPREIALVGDQGQLAPLLEVVRGGYRPFQVLAAGGEGDNSPVPLLANRPTLDGAGTAYVCRRFVCAAPVTDPRELEAQL